MPDNPRLRRLAAAREGRALRHRLFRMPHGADYDQLVRRIDALELEEGLWRIAELGDQLAAYPDAFTPGMIAEYRSAHARLAAVMDELLGRTDA